MEIGMMSRWGAAKPGREKEAAELYDRSVAYLRRLLQERKITHFEPFFFSSGDSEVEWGFFIVKGPVAEMFGIMDSDEYREMTAQARLLLEHTRTDLLTVGEGIDRLRADNAKAVSAVHH